MNELPSGWVEVQLGDLGSEVRGSVLAEPEKRYELWSVPSFATGAPELVRGEAIGSAKRPVNPDDVLVCKINPRINRVWLVGPKPADRIQLASPEWMTFRIPDQGRVLPRYLRWYLSSPRFRDWIALAVSGATGSHTRAKSGSILRQMIPVPPLEEQRRIVTILEDHLSRLDAAGQGLAASRSRLTSLRASLFDRAVSVDAERIRLRDLSWDAGYGTSTRCAYEAPGPAVVRIPNLANGAIDLTDEKRSVDPSVDLSDYALVDGDLLIVRTNGSRDLIGRAAVVRGDLSAAFASYLIRFRLHAVQVSPEWVWAVLESPRTRKQIHELAASSAGQYNLNLKKLGSLLIPVPDLAEQTQRMALLTKALDDVVRQELALSDAVRRSDRLRQSLLEAAFSDRWTPLNETKEPVVV